MNKAKEYKPIKIAKEDHLAINILRLKLIAKEGRMVSLSDTVMQGIELLERKVGK